MNINRTKVKDFTKLWTTKVISVHNIPSLGKQEEMTIACFTGNSSAITNKMAKNWIEESDLSESNYSTIDEDCYFLKRVTLLN